MIEVLILTYQRLGYLKKCLDSLYNQKNVNLRINIWDNGSHPKMKKWIKNNVVDAGKLNGGIFFNNPNNIGTARARNQAIEQIKSNEVFMSDDDMWYEPHYCSHVQKVWDVLKNQQGDRQFAILGNYEPYTDGKYKKLFKDKVIIGKYEIHYLRGIPPGNWFFDRNIIKSIGGFWMPSDHLMGFSAMIVQRKLNSFGFKTALIRKINGKRYKGVIHMDSLKSKFCIRDRYPKYNQFRTYQKNTERVNQATPMFEDNDEI